MFLINQAMESVGIGTAAVIVVSAQEKKKAAAAPAAAAKPMPAATPAKPAPGTAGELKLHDVPPRVAAQLMAIVAYKTGKPVNELRFRSIREIKE